MNNFLRMEKISKRFKGVIAVDDVTVYINRGEVHALVGENGAGKSTLMKILAGICPRDEGTVLLENELVPNADPHATRTMGISMIPQEIDLCPDLTVGENVFLSQEPVKFWGLIDWKKLWEKTERILNKRLKTSIHPKAFVRDLSVVEKQLIEIARALSFEAKVIIMDEPTALLTELEREVLFRIVRDLKSDDKTVIYITHELEEIFQLADRVTVMKDGRKTETLHIKETNLKEIVQMMVGRPLISINQQQKTRDVASSPTPLLEIRNFSSQYYTNINFELRASEVLGLTGMIDSGCIELVESIFGLASRESGELFVEGKQLGISSPKDAIEAGFGLVPQDRKQQGLILKMVVRENVSLPILDRICHGGVIDAKVERHLVKRFVKQLSIITTGLDQRAYDLSGGNQQKVVIAKWLSIKPRILILESPTRGIDVGTKREIYRLIYEFASKGVGIIMVSFELPEVLGISDRILVIRKGHLVAQFKKEEATEEKIVHCALAD